MPKLDSMISLSGLVWKSLSKKCGNEARSRELYRAKIDLDKEFDKVRKAIKKKEKKAQNRALCIAAYLEDAPNLSFQEYEFIYNEARGHHDKEEEEKELKDLPWRLAVGVSMILGGGFLVIAGNVLKIPVCVQTGKELAMGGVFFVVEGYNNGKEDQQEKDRK
ncbi:putative membrane protein (plasmid) [Candidatus Protochlamydia naegleriophila]|uniref:Putative membrane protein n=2 Tax=Candidatus Protochlamydia naegleriophila TaxID=389348 RepID=A0A0U5EV08_9BACT|nr:putative membrane protein [Candidatus Protochlamydia naegleriophila]